MITKAVFEDFARISPKWAEMYQTYKFQVLIDNTFCKDNLCKSGDDRSDMSDELLNMNNSVSCVLGEAHGFEEKHTYDDCEDCFDYSQDFNTYDEKEFESNITPFVKHFKSKHKKLFNAK